MFKKSITRIEKDVESSQVELSNPVLHDIIPSNHVVLTKGPRSGRLSRACKAAIGMIIFGLLAIGIVVLTLALAHSRNNLLAEMSRSSGTDPFSTLNNSRNLLFDQQNLTTLFVEPREDNRQTTAVTLTSHNFHRLTTPNVHTSSSSSSSSPTTMRTKQPTERPSSSNAPSMKPYPSSHASVNERSTVSTTLQTSTSTLTFSSRRPSQSLITTNGELLPTTQNERVETTDADSLRTQEEIRTTEKDLDEVQTSSSTTPMTSAVYRTRTGRQDQMSSMPEETSFTTFINLYFDLQSSTMTTSDATETTTTPFAARHHSRAHTVATSKKNSNDDDIMDDLLLS